MKIDINSAWSGNKDYGMDIGPETDFFACQDNFRKLDGIGVTTIFDNFSSSSDHCMFTIAIPAYKRSDLLKQCLESAINQKTDKEYRVIVMDNNPERNDETEMLMKQYSACGNLSYFKEERNVGAFNNMNRAVIMTESPWTLIIHDDDMLRPECIEQMAQYVERFKDCHLFSSERILIDETVKNHRKLTPRYFFTHLEEMRRIILRRMRVASDKVRFRRIDSRIREIHSSLDAIRLVPRDFISGNRVAPTGTLYNREAFLESGGFNDEFGPAADYVFFAMLSSKDKVMRVCRPLFYYRLCANESFNPKTIMNMRLVDHYLSVALMKKYSDYSLDIREKYAKTKLWAECHYDLDMIKKILGDEDFKHYSEINGNRHLFEKINRELLMMEYKEGC